MLLLRFRTDGPAARELQHPRLLSEIQREQGNLEAAPAPARAVLDIALTLRNFRQEGYRYSPSATPSRPPATFSYQRSATLHRRLGDRSREALAWHGAGETYRRLDRPAEPADFHRQAATTHHDLDDATSPAAERWVSFTVP